MKYSVMLGIALGFLSAITLGTFANEPAKMTQKELAEFKGMCLRNKNALKYEDGQWVCVSTQESEDGLTSLPIKLPK